jgi:hypothetical protein
MQPGFTHDYEPATTIAEADADLMAMIELAAEMAKQSTVLRPDTANFVGSLHTIEEIAHHLARAQSLCRWLQGVHAKIE